MGTFNDTVATLVKNGEKFIETTIRYATPAEGKCSTFKLTLSDKVEVIEKNPTTGVYERTTSNKIYAAVGQVKDCVSECVKNGRYLNTTQLAASLGDVKIKLYKVEYRAKDKYTNVFTGDTGTWDHDNVFYYIVGITVTDELTNNAKAAKKLILNPNADIDDLL